MAFLRPFGGTESGCRGLDSTSRMETGNRQGRGLRFRGRRAGDLAPRRTADEGIPVTERSQSKSHNPRLGQGSFRLIVTDSYERLCAFTNFPVRHVLEAVHIRPYSSGGSHIPSNGILLRQDLHTLFDRGYRTATPPHQVEVSSRIKEEFNNGKGVRPAGTRDRPSRAAGLSTRRNERSDSAPAGSPASRRSSSRADFPRSFGR